MVNTAIVIETRHNITNSAGFRSGQTGRPPRGLHKIMFDGGLHKNVLKN